MSQHSDSTPYRFPALEGQDVDACSSAPRGASGCSSMAQLHRMAGYSQGGADLGLRSEGSDSSGGRDPPASSHKHRKNGHCRSLPEEDVEMKSSGSSGSGTESHGNESRGRQSVGSSNGTSKDSALLESSESNKSFLIHRRLDFPQQDIFAVAVSVITGRIVYISDQAASILNCKREVFKNSKFVEFLTPQDVSVFHSFTTPYRLPSWSMCTGAESSSAPDCMQEKSFFCRIRGGKECEGALQYYPFRMTPYRMKVQDTVHAEDQFCCLLLAERVHSGYDAPRIPTDKRIFTTTHTPSCLFQDVDERAVPLLGYLPQDLIGTSILLHLHPSDRPVMLAIHKKILQFAGQPFDHSSVRFCARNGEYIVLDTSWSSFVNPWSRKVSFVIGRHKVCMGPVNGDVFVGPLPAVREMKTMESDIQEITEQIHRLLLQPVLNSGSSGYGSLNRNDLVGMSSSSESLNNGSGSKIRPEEEEEEEEVEEVEVEELEVEVEELEVSGKARTRTFQEICKGIHLQKTQEHQTTKHDVKKSSSIEPLQRSKDSPHWKQPGAPMEESRSSAQEDFNHPSVSSYQQISCLDSVVRSEQRSSLDGDARAAHMLSDQVLLFPGLSGAVSPSSSRRPRSSFRGMLSRRWFSSSAATVWSMPGQLDTNVCTSCIHWM
ncbi:Period circadian 2 [Liparis tanakae]|uniref:Period circadian protein homolog 2 n=1 Tax=Liparis tanakae TaxID=230148 RepID=A0A4Z2FBN1_9TELE|nr:Period circadian 2 [Liparis tanakae]